MHLRRCTQKKGKKQYCYWQLVESYRTERGPRQRVVAYLGDIPESKRLGVKAAAKELNAAPALHQRELFEDTEPEWIGSSAQIGVAGVPAERHAEGSLVRGLGQHGAGVDSVATVRTQ
jgi:hypothetical protein